MIPERAIEIACGVKWTDVLSHTRALPVVDARSIYAAYWREQGQSLSHIGLMMRRDHSTVYSLLQRHEAMMRYKDYAEKQDLFARLIVRDPALYENTIPTMKIKFKRLSPDAMIPAKAHATDAGFDLTCTSVEEDRRHNCVSYGTGIAVEIPVGYAGFLFPRSSVYKEDIDLTNCVGVIDAGYRGEIMAKYRILQPHIHRYTVGDRIGQLIIMPLPEIEFAECDSLSDSDRGTGGYGSTGK